MGGSVVSGQSRKMRAIIVDEKNNVRKLTTTRETDKKRDIERKKRIDRRRSKSEGSYQ